MTNYAKNYASTIYQNLLRDMDLILYRKKRYMHVVKCKFEEGPLGPPSV